MNPSSNTPVENAIQTDCDKLSVLENAMRSTALALRALLVVLELDPKFRPPSDFTEILEEIGVALDSPLAWCFGDPDGPVPLSAQALEDYMSFTDGIIAQYAHLDRFPIGTPPSNAADEPTSH